MGYRPDNLSGLISNPLETEIRGGYFVLAHALVGVAQGASLSQQPGQGGVVARLVAGPGSWLRASVQELGQSCERDYILRGGTMEFDSKGPLQVLWTRLGVEEPGGTLILGQRTPDAGLLLVDLTFHADLTRIQLSIVFRKVTRVTATYDSVANVTLIGMLGNEMPGLDRNVWAVVRLPGNVCAFSSENSEKIRSDGGQSGLYMRNFVAEGSEDTYINVSKKQQTN
ncbi:hypothetical protein HNW77_15190 [Komagataeibacter sp. AV436]|uniref:Uncharacterized protein n=1 Tax=Komagataeibacter melomenusus TaxID=2766578 RepID=A0ABX2AH93_9PROT|nr:hypothetical protein [Komagataeibacter melomenusus]MBV1831953.1 hypothetical protein [Komagataeibacter melomenusus]NPC67699.1 hypothetical protein [Komagataeibacter melomenusus]